MVGNNLAEVNFRHLRMSDWRTVHSVLNSGGFVDVAKRYASFLEEWNDHQNVDGDLIFETICQLETLGFWSLLSPEKFLHQYGDAIKPHVREIFLWNATK